MGAGLLPRRQGRPRSQNETDAALLRVGIGLCRREDTDRLYWTAQAGKEASLERILVAVDGSDGALKAVEIAAELAAKTGASLTALAVIGAADVLAVVRSEGLGVDAAVAARLHAAAEYLTRCQSIARRHGVVRCHSEKRAGDDPATAILDFAREHAIGLIVVGNRGMGRLPGLLLGSVSQRLASLAPCSLLIAR
jgi:nucleotide-binding universal stress UspA family protein